MAVRTPSGRTFPGNFTIIPSTKKWVFHAIFCLAFTSLYGEQVCSMNHLVLTDEEDTEYCSFETMIATHDSFKSSTVMLCIFHAIWQPFKKEIYMVLSRKSSPDQPVELSDVGRKWGTSVFCIDLYFLYSDFLADIVCFLSLPPAEFLYKIFQHQACVYRTRDQYDRSHEILTEVLDLDTTRQVRSG
jgi:hypothetical protein